MFASASNRITAFTYITFQASVSALIQLSCFLDSGFSMQKLNSTGKSQMVDHPNQPHYLQNEKNSAQTADMN